MGGTGVPMPLNVAIFEDDIDIADLLKEMMESPECKVSVYYNFKDNSWIESDVVLGDFRNHLIPFQDLKQECLKNDIPLIAISGADTTHTPQLLKPFSVEDLQMIIQKTVIEYRKDKINKVSDRNQKEQVKESSVVSIFKKGS
jgi:DNA-binding NtrC family response regulator